MEDTSPKKYHRTWNIGDFYDQRGNSFDKYLSKRGPRVDQLSCRRLDPQQVKVRGCWNLSLQCYGIPGYDDTALCLWLVFKWKTNSAAGLLWIIKAVKFIITILHVSLHFNKNKTTKTNIVLLLCSNQLHFCIYFPESGTTVYDSTTMCCFLNTVYYFRRWFYGLGKPRRKCSADMSYRHAYFRNSQGFIDDMVLSPWDRSNWAC